MRYEGRIFRPPSEADAYILQATIGCSWNHCTYCDMYRDKRFRVRELAETMADLEAAGQAYGPRVRKLFVADGDALVLDMEHWEAILAGARRVFPNLRRVSAYATSMNILAKTPEHLRALREQGLSLLYIGPESGDDETMKRIAKGSGFAEHAEAAERAHAAGMEISTIFLLGAGGTERSAEHAEASARLVTAIDPEFFSALTLTIVPGTPMDTLAARGRFEPRAHCAANALIAQMLNRVDINRSHFREVALDQLVRSVRTAIVDRYQTHVAVQRLDFAHYRD